jgi:hypothetical protein
VTAAVANHIAFPFTPMLSPISPVLTKELVSLIEEQRVAWNIPGISLGVVRLDGGIETHGLGVMNVDGDAVTAEVQIVFLIPDCIAYVSFPYRRCSL